MEREYDQESTDRLLAALYGDESVDSDELADLESFRSMRAMFAEVPEFEPPSSISDELMKAAAAAVAKDEKPSFAERLRAFFGPVFAHPAMAAAASLVLVASIGGVLMLKGKAQVADPEYEASAPATSAEKSGDEFATGDLDEDKATAVPDPISVDGKISDTPKKPKTTGTIDNTRKVARPRTPPQNGTGSPSGVSGSVQSTVELGVKESEEPEPDEEARKPGEDRSWAAEPKSDPPPPPPPSTKLEKLKKDAEVAAKGGKCSSVRKIGDQVAKLDSAYFDGEFLSSDAIARCYKAKK